MDDAQNDILSRRRTIERRLQDTLGQQNEYFRNLFQSARQDGQNQDDIQTLRFNAFQKVVLAQGVTAGADSVEVRKEINALEAKINSLDGQVAAIRNEQLEFQTKIAADILSLSTQLGDLVDYIRGGDAKKGEGSSSSRPLLPPINQGEGSGGDTIRTIEIAQRDILERLMAAYRQWERERDSGSETVGLSNQVFELSGQIVTVENAIRAMVAANRKDYITNSIFDRYGNSEVQQEQYNTVNSEGCCQQRFAY
ncbi:hypothetical protein F511_39300 [Dorcoceras hygrometricum]|uniref:Uncharacterized protein n=1 Tax=Dorcoceras hygrometricum TaxID=472368 RepID=A0A2Z7AFQ5_9LAMI|nr:hypothetical protein F511_39300 [Dorcoceras hygrometricum]